MIRRMLCLLCAVLILVSTVPAYSEDVGENSSYDFDLTFHLNADSFPVLVRTRVAGYASLINRLGLRGTVAWSDKTQSFDLDATLYFTDDPSLTYPFRLYGTESRIFITSPLINNEIILLNMTALMEFALKAKNTLGVPLSYIALLFPYTTKSAFRGMAGAWQDTIGTSTKSRKISIKHFRELSVLWTNELLNNGLLHWWITGLASGSDVPAAVEAEMDSLPSYYEMVTGGKSISVSVSAGSEVWKNATGETLFSRQESDNGLSMLLSLPASGNGYIPYLSYERRDSDQAYSFDAAASIAREASASSSDVSPDSRSGEYGYDEEYDSDEDYGDYDDYDDDYDGWYASEEDFPDLLIEFYANGTSLPRQLPADSAFSLSASVIGALYPDYAFYLSGTTKKDGSVTLSLNKPFDDNTVPVEIFQCSGTFVPSATPKNVPDYMKESLVGVYNVFSFNEQKLAAFRSKVLPPLVRSIFSFVAAAPTSACQSFLDDLTDIGILDMLLE